MVVLYKSRLLIYTVGAGLRKSVTACVNKKKEEFLVELEF